MWRDKAHSNIISILLELTGLLLLYTMSAPDRRRNRSLASCEPCRKGKIRCDHQKPVCASCRRRQAQSECWYHPAPLTKQTPQVIRASRVPRRPRDRESRGASNISNKVPKSLVSSAKTTEATSGSSQVSKAFNENTPHEDQISTMIHIVTRLETLPLIERLLNRYFSVIHSPLLAKPVVLQTVASLRGFLAASGYIQQETELRIVIRDLQRLAEHILRASSSEITLTPSMSLQDFCSVFSGENIRVETLGFLYTVAARASIHETLAMPESKDFIQEMSWYSNASLHLAREIAPKTSDMIIWLALDNLQLITMLEGDASKRHGISSWTYLLMLFRHECLATHRRFSDRNIRIGSEPRGDLFIGINTILSGRVPQENVQRCLLSGQIDRNILQSTTAHINTAFRLQASS